MTQTPVQQSKPLPDLADVPYGPHPRHRMDFWRPQGKTPAPLVVYFHGGGFRAGDKSSFHPPVLNGCLEAGFAAAAVNYRFSNDSTTPAFFLDGVRAIQFLRHNARAWGIDPARIAATGGSAGGGISLWVGFHPDLADPASSDPVGQQSSAISCIGVYDTQPSYDPRFYREIGLAPAADHPFMPPFCGMTYEQMESPEAQRRFIEAAPQTYFHAGGPPVFLYFTGSEDPLPHGATAPRSWTPENPKPPADPLMNRAIHHPKLGRIIKKQLDDLGVECELHVAVPKDQIPAMQGRMVDFFRRHFQKP